MFNKLFRQSLKPWNRTLHDKAYRAWLQLFDVLNNENLKFPTQQKALGLDWNIHNGQAFLNQFETIFIDQLYKFECDLKQPLIIDCGANMGTSVMYFKWLFPNAEIHAFEPDATIFEVLETNVKKNHLKSIHLHNKAVWINNNDMFFSSNNSQSGKLVLEAKDVKVACLRLKDYMKNFKSIDLLKLDIEGAELIVLHDISSELNRVNHLFIEYHSTVHEPQKLSQLLQILEDENFRYYIGGNHSTSPFINKVIEEGMDLTLDIFATRI